MRAVVTALATLTVALAACPGEIEDPGVPPTPQDWTALCDGLDVGACLDDGPLVCGDNGPPRATCETCGCPGGDACVVTDGDDGVCASRAVREAVRDDDTVSDGLADDVYLALWTLLEDEAPRALPLGDWLDVEDRLRARDGRRRVVVVGREDGDRADVVVDALRARGATDLATDDAVGLPCDGRAEAAAALPVASEIGADVDAIIDVGAVDDAHSGLCAFAGSVPHCVLPHRASCLARGGAVGPAVVIVDDDVFLARLDDALVRSVARVGRDQWEQRLDSVIATFSGLVLRHRPEARFAFGDDDDGEVRVVEVPTIGASAPFEGPLFLAWLPRFDVRPVRGIAFRALWLDGPTRVFLTAHDVVPADCDFDPGLTGVVEVVCVASDGAVVEATVDAARAALIDVEVRP